MARGRSAGPAIGIAAMVAAAILLVVGTVYANQRGRIDPATASAANASVSAARSSAAAASEAAEPPVVAFLGDSFGEGTGADDPATTGLASQVAAQMGWELANLSQGGTGYIAEGPQEIEGRAAFPDRVARVVAIRPDIVVVEGGINDSGQDRTTAQITDGVDATLTGIRDGLPGVPIIVIGPFWPNGSPVPEVSNVDQVVEDATTRLGLPFVSPLERQWITGDTTADENAATYTGPDGTHPSQAGHDYLAGLIVEFLRTLPGLPAPAAAPAAATG